jgi:glycosyltransferase involved in cell wall biosynthesis
MKVAIITPYHGENEQTLLRCLQSVQQQTHAAAHIVVADGAPEHSRQFVEELLRAGDQQIVIPIANADYGDTPRLIGSTVAYNQGFDAVCWLDADCWLEAEHVAEMTDIANLTVSSVVTATRNLRRPDGSLLAVCSESDGDTFCDTNCYLVMRDAMPSLVPFWGFKPRRDAVVGDRRVWGAAKAFQHSHNPIPTVNYETKIASHYLERNEEPPEDARVITRVSGESFFRSIPYRDLRG